MLKNGFLLIGGFIFMRELHLGDKTVPAIGLGTWHMGNSTATRAKEIKAIQAGIDAGATVIDTAVTAVVKVWLVKPLPILTGKNCS